MENANALVHALVNDGCRMQTRMCVKNELKPLMMDTIHFNNRRCLIVLMLSALGFLKIGDANGAELALLGGPAVFR